jgi:hypothetical protein
MDGSTRSDGTRIAGVIVMKQNEIVVGGTYVTLVSGQEVRVKVLGNAVEPYSFGDRVRRAEYPVLNLTTGNKLKRTAAALRRRIVEGSEGLDAFYIAALKLGAEHTRLNDLPADEARARPVARVQARFPLVAMPARDELIAACRQMGIQAITTVGKAGSDAAGTCSVVAAIAL